MDIKIDRQIYNDACITKAVYSLSKQYVINRTLEGTIETWHLEPLNSVEECGEAEKTVLTALNDYKLRQIIEEETHDIRTILYAKAFADFDDIEDHEKL